METLTLFKEEKLVKNKYISRGFISQGVFVFLFFSFFSAFLSYSQGYLVHCYSETDGLPSITAFDVTQDHWGRIWCATRSGIAVYDGVSWESYTVSNGLPALSFFKISVDQKGRIWALSDNGQDTIFLVYYDGNRWNQMKKFTIHSGHRVELTSFRLVDQKQMDKPIIAVGTAGHGLYLLNQGKWENVTEKNGLLSNSVNGMVSLKGKFYVATDKGLSIININVNNNLRIDNQLNQSLNLPSKKIKGIGVEHKGKYPDFDPEHSRIWLFGHEWIGYFEENRARMTLYPVEILLSKKKEVVKLLPDYRQGLYIGNHYELNYFNYRTHSWESLTVNSGLIGEGANSMFIDFEKNIWIACDRGLNKISSRRFGNFQRIHGLLEDEVTAVLEYEPGKFVLGHNNGLTFYDGKKFLKMPFLNDNISRLSIRRVLDMQLDSKKNIWLAMAWGGLAKINPRNKHRITWYGKADGLPDYIVCLWIDETDTVWVGTGKGIFFRTPNGFVSKNIGEFSTPNPRKLYGFSGKLLCIGDFEAGVYVYQENKWKNVQFPGDRKANAVYALKKDSKGRLLIGTLKGVFILENESIRKFKINDFQVDRPVYFILEDNKNRLWFGTDNGVVRWDGKRERKYSIDEGLIGQETNRAAAIVDSRERIWIGTNRGVSVYDEQFDNNECCNPAPKIQLLYAEVADKRIPLKKPVRLTYKENTIAIHFRGISFIDETSIRFKNKLEGFEAGWSDEGYPYNQVIKYTNLSSGTYRFHLKARNALGVWSEVVTSPDITILKPFYYKWWFFLSLSLLMGFVFYSIFRFFSEKRHAALLERLVGERTGQLQASEKRYRTLFEESKDVLFITSRNGRILNMNPAGVILFGYRSKEEILNVDLRSDIYYHPSDRDVFLKEIEAKGYVKDYELVFKRKDGEKITALVTAAFIPGGEGESEAIRGIIRDITENKKLQQQLEQAQKMEALGTLAGGVAHDFNNILAVITGYLELSLDDLPKDSLVRQNIEQVLIAASRGKELVDQILTFSRMGTQERKPLKLSIVIKEVLKLLRSSLPATIEIRQDITAVPDIVTADPTQMQQVVVNLCTNAAHAMRKEGGLLKVELHKVYLDEESAAAYNYLVSGPYLRLVVSDTGHGIDPAIIKRIFEPYFTTKKKGEGTGMGLAVIHGIVKSHGGEITVYSEKGRGTTFHVLLPAAREPETVQIGGLQEPAATGGKERILFVDDEMGLVEVGQKILEKLGYTVAAENSSVAALEIFRTAPDRFDLVITDLTMPNMTGIQLTRELQNIRPGIPVIICTGFSESITEKQIKGLGIRKLLIKPINKAILAKTIREALEEP
jgi:PAS domain S-box-containing protein